DVEQRHTELDGVGGSHLRRHHQLVLDQVLGDRLAGLAGRVQGLAGRVLGQCPVHDQAPGNAGDPHQIGMQGGRHRETLSIPHPGLYRNPPAPRMPPPSQSAPWERRKPRYPLPLPPGGPRMHLSIILPAKNEAPGLRQTLPGLRDRFPEAEVIVVDDGSTDETAAVATEYGARVLSAPYSMGNGAAITRGARAASGEILVFMDADGQHDPALIPRLLEKLDEGYDLVVGARNGSGQANVGRGLANAFYNRLATWMTGHRIADLTSGF